MAELVITPSAVRASAAAHLIPGVAGDTLQPGDCVYYRASSEKWHLAKADGAANGMQQDDLVGVALAHAYPNQPLVIVLFDYDLDLGATLVKGETYVASSTNAGKIMPVGDLTAFGYRCLLGVAKDTQYLSLNKNASGATA